jgi:hypothetical protein
MDNPIFTDLEIQAFLDLNNQRPRLAAASALETIAANEVYVQKRIKILDLWTNGPSEATELRQLAKSLREQDDIGLGDEDPMFDIAEQVFDPFSERQRLRNVVMREQG